MITRAFWICLRIDGNLALPLLNCNDSWHRHQKDWKVNKTVSKADNQVSTINKWKKKWHLSVSNGKLLTFARLTYLNEENGAPFFPDFVFFLLNSIAGRIEYIRK